MKAYSFECWIRKTRLAYFADDSLRWFLTIKAAGREVDMEATGGGLVFGDGWRGTFARLIRDARAMLRDAP